MFRSQIWASMVKGLNIQIIKTQLKRSSLMIIIVVITNYKDRYEKHYVKKNTLQVQEPTRLYLNLEAITSTSSDNSATLLQRTQTTGET